MRKITVAIALAAMVLGPAAFAQKSPVAAPPAGQPDANPIPGVSSDTTTVTVQPDPSATPMADPQSAAEYGSPSAVGTPSSPMPDPAGWPTPKPGMKRPNWVKKAPPSGNPPPPPEPK